MTAMRALIFGILALAVLTAPCSAQQQLSPYEQAKAHQFLRMRLADIEEDLAKCVARTDVAGMTADATLKWVLDNWVPKPETVREVK